MAFLETPLVSAPETLPPEMVVIASEHANGG